jgi:hypothetical protein
MMLQNYKDNFKIANLVADNLPLHPINRHTRRRLP